jgi:hypothetical protein
MVGLLILFGVDPSAAGAAALIQRGMMAGTAVVLGLTSYSPVRRSFRLGGVFQITSRGRDPHPET